MFEQAFTWAHVVDLVQIILIDLSLAADNALVVGMAVAALPREQRKRTMMMGIVLATLLRIVMALFAVELLKVTGLLLAGGVLLGWVTWKMWREYLETARQAKAETEAARKLPPAKRMSEAVKQIVIADISMSLDNVLAVAGVARDHMMLLTIGLVLSVGLMAVASNWVSQLTIRYPKTVLVGIAIIFYTALHMIYDGGKQLGLWGALAALG